jgi:4-amino-4-deoxy-L-arabinose transferase-like glycosyltransferase
MSFSFLKSKFLTDIRFWIVVFFLIRLIGITNPPLEVAHNWRQTTVTMVARNFLEVDHNILYPRIDIAGEKTGITGMEFPALNYLIYISAEIFGYQHWYGRLINLFFSSFGIWFFFRLLQKYFSHGTAFNATIILIVSIWFQFSRKIMPDTFSMSLILASLYFGSNYLESTKKNALQWSLLWYVLLMCLGVLSKLPSAYLLVVMAVFFFNKSISSRKKAIFGFISIIGILPSIFWYFIWVPHIVQEYGFTHFFMGKGMAVGFAEIANNLGETLNKFYDTALKYVGFLMFLVGVIYAVKDREKRIYLPLLLCFFGFAIVIVKAGYTFPHHSYYIVPFVPVMALVAGYGLSRIRIKKLALFLLLAIVGEGVGNQQHDFRVRDKDLQLVHLEKDLNSFSSLHDLILINSGEFPTPMYFAHRKGWVNSNDRIQDVIYVNELKTRGLKFIVILKRSIGSEIELEGYEVMFDSEDYVIYRV